MCSLLWVCVSRCVFTCSLCVVHVFAAFAQFAAVVVNRCVACWFICPLCAFRCSLIWFRCSLFSLFSLFVFVS